MTSHKETLQGINGWIILDKPYGMTSTLASNLVRRITKSGKAGHAGTLDPLATGVLPIALGTATKTIPYAVGDIKEYSFQVTWGEQRITDDAEGAIIATSEQRPNTESILAVLPQFIGTIQQRPPIFSALKIEGKRAYDLARSGDPAILKTLNQTMDCKTRPITIHNLVLKSIDSQDQATFHVTCGPGTYVRSLARDIAAALDTVAYVSMLRRLRVGKFQEKDAISLEKLREIRHKSLLHRVILPLGAVLDDIPAVPVTREEATRICQGQRIQAQVRQVQDSLVVLQLVDQVIAIAHQCDGYFYPKRVFKE